MTKLSPVETVETPHPLDMTSGDAIYLLDAVEALIEAISMQYTVEGSMSTSLVSLALSNLHIAQVFLMALDWDLKVDVPVAKPF